MSTTRYANLMKIELHDFTSQVKFNQLLRAISHSVETLVWANGLESFTLATGPYFILSGLPNTPQSTITGSMQEGTRAVHNRCTGSGGDGSF